MSDRARVYVSKPVDREEGVKALLEQYNLDDYRGSEVALKANYNSDDPFPASTHIDTLRNLVKGIRDSGASRIILAERSGMGDTRRVLENRGVMELGKDLGFEVVVLDKLDKDGWSHISGDGNHWLRGFHIARMFLEADMVVQTYCLKTHRFGGDFTLSLKNSVGLVAKRLTLYDYMMELHVSPWQRKMIAEINQHYPCDLVIMDAMKGFTDDGPEKGTLVEPGLMLASDDRVAMDAVGVALLRSYGTTKKVSEGAIFEQDQIKRAAEIGVGVDSIDKIDVMAVNQEAEETVSEVEMVLGEG